MDKKKKDFMEKCRKKYIDWKNWRENTDEEN